MHCVWSRWPAWSGSSCNRLQCTVPGSTSPTLSGISPAAIIAYFSGTCKSRCRFPPPFSAAFDRPHRSPMGPFTVGFHRRFPWTATLSGLLPLFFVGRLPQPSPPPDWDFRRFPLCGPLSRTAAEIFTGSLGASRVLWKLPRRRLPHFWGACAFYLLSMVSLHTKTSFLTKPHGQSCLSRLSTVYRMAPGSRSRSLRFRLTICSRSLIHSDWLSQRLVVPLTMDIF